MRYIRVTVYLFIVVLLLTASGMFAYALYMKNSNSGYQCEHFTYEDVKSLVINFNERFPESFSMEEFSQTGEMQYLKGKSGDVILLPFETISGNYRAEVTCDGGVDIAPGVSS